MEFNIYGSPFSHMWGGNLGYSTHGQVPSYVNWKWNCDTHLYEDSFYMNFAIPTVINDTLSKKKYGAICESKAIIPHIFEGVKNEWEKYVEIFDTFFVHDYELLSLHPKFKFAPPTGTWIKDKQVHPKTKLVSMITSAKTMCEGHITRLKWADKLKDDIDMYGGYWRGITNKEEGLVDYMFSVAIENGVYDGLFSEKVLDCFATGTIPIYLGSKKITDFFNKDGIIFLEEDFDIRSINEELYYSKIEAVKENFEKVKQFSTFEDYVYLNYFKDGQSI
jgi:hypothetical protein